MNDRGSVQHNSAICSLPLNEHSGNEPCLVWVEAVDEIPAPMVVAHYKTGPSGLQVSDHRADMLARYGPVGISGPLGTPEIRDLRDNRDPAEVGARELAVRAANRNGSEK